MLYKLSLNDDQLIMDKEFQKQEKPLLEVKNLSKTFYLNEDRKETLKSFVASFFNQGKTKKFQALQDVNLTVKRGEFVGIIGRNGSGKSTFLKLVAGVYNPDKGGKVKVRGKLVPFLELGVGFNPELTGRENVYLNGTILGMTRKFLNQKFDEIIEFAELEDFVETPVKNYSSGMMVRLAFSIAIQADADMFLLDEILAVGDENFQQKSVNVINNLKRQGKSVLFVSHSMDAIETFCDRAIVIQDSHVVFDGKTNQAVDKYRSLNTESTISEKVNESGGLEKRYGDHEIEISKVEILDEANKVTKLYRKKGEIRIRMHYKKNKENIEKAIFGVSLSRADGLLLTGTNTKIYDFEVKLKNEGYVDYVVSSEYFSNGVYFISVGVFNQKTVKANDFHSLMYKFEVRLYNKDIGVIALPCEWKAG